MNLYCLMFDVIKGRLMYGIDVKGRYERERRILCEYQRCIIGNDVCFRFIEVGVIVMCVGDGGYKN